MATRTIANAGGDYASNATWVEGVAPTIADDVVATATSGNLTISTSVACRSFDFTNYVGTLNITTGGILGVFGSAGTTAPCKFVAGMTITSVTGSTLNLRPASATAQLNLTMNGKTWPASISSGLVGAGALGSVVLQDALALTTLTLFSGSFDTNSKAVSAASVVLGSVTNTRSLTLGTSTITLTSSGGWSVADPTGLTLSAASSTIALSSTTQTFAGGGLSYGTLTHTFGNTTLTITGANTFNNVTLTGGANTGNALTLGADQVVTGTLTITSNAVTRRIIVQSDVVGTTRQITAAAVSFTDVDFMDIAGAGAASPFTGTRLGDAGGNSGITMATPKTVYLVGVTAPKNWDTTNQWALTSGGVGAGNNFPLLQDTAIIDGNSGNNTLTLSYVRISSIDASAANSITVTTSVSSSVYGSLDFRGCVSAVTAGTNGFTWRARGSTTLRHGGKFRMGGTLTLTAPGGTLKLLDDLLTGGALTLNNGTFDANNKNVTCLNVGAASTGGVRTVNTGTGTWLLTGTGSVISLTALTSQLTWNNQGAKFVVTDTSTSTKTVNIGGAGAWRIETLEVRPGRGDSGAVILTGTSAQIGTLRVYAPNTISLAASLVYDTVETHGYPGNLVTFNSTSPGTRRNINQRSAVTNTWTSDYIAIQDVAHVLSAGQSPWYLGANSTDLGNNATIGTTMLLQKAERPVPTRAVAGARSVGTEGAGAHVAY